MSGPLSRPEPGPEAPASSVGPAQALRDQAGAVILLSALFYLAVQIVYVQRLPLVMDEFQGAQAVERLSREIPYRDFQPYKSVLGYYLQWPAMQLGRDLWSGMIAVKLATAAAVAVLLVLAGRRLCRHFDPAAVALALPLLAAMSSFLERSADLRVDMLTALFGLFSLLALLDGQTLRAGLLAGISFLVSQKGVYYAISGGAALGLEWALGARSRRPLAGSLRFAAASATPIALYFAAFASNASMASVTDVVVSPGRVAFDDFYSLRHFWLQTLSRNPGFYAAALGGLGVLAVRLRGPSPRNRILFGYGSALLVLCAWHKQPWPYFFVLLAPTAAVLAAACFETFLERRPSGRALRIALAAYVAIGLLVPLSRVPQVLRRDNAFQRETVELAADLLETDDRYLAGLAMVYTHRQVPGLSWLDGRRLALLERAPAAELDALGERVAEARPKLLLWNYRLARLPERLRSRLQARYAPLFGNVFVYAPPLPSDGVIDLWFAGRYVLSGPAGSVSIDDLSLESNDAIVLAKGSHRVRAAPGFRLHWFPSGIERRVARLDPSHARPQPLFADAYTY